MIVPADFTARVATLVGTPFRIKGDDRDGWDCRGCGRWIYRNILGVAVEDYRDAYEASGFSTATGRARRAHVIAERLAAWRPVAVQAGAIVQLTWLGRSGHVGVMLDRRCFIHADQGVGTTIADLADRACAYRPVGWFVPSYVTEVLHG